MAYELKRIRKYLFIILPVVLAITFFSRNDYRSVADIDSEILRDPIQTQLKSANPITFQKDNFSYTITPLYDYDIAGLLVHHLNYNTWYSLSRVDSVFPTDLCLIWGDNIKNGSYKSKSVRFTQDFRFCLYYYSGNDTPINNSEASNNHLVIQSDNLRKIAENLNTGDQVRIKGKLVNVEARPIGNIGDYEPNDLIWPTSVTRDDSGAGACEVIYVESIQILKKGNPISNLFFLLSNYGLFLTILWVILEMFYTVFLARRSA